MSEIPRLKKHTENRKINIVIDRMTDDLYRLAKQNGYDSSEIARRAVVDAFRKLSQDIKKPADEPNF